MHQQSHSPTDGQVSERERKKEREEKNEIKKNYQQLMKDERPTRELCSREKAPGVMRNFQPCYSDRTKTTVGGKSSTKKRDCPKRESENVHSNTMCEQRHLNLTSILDIYTSSKFFFFLSFLPLASPPRCLFCARALCFYRNFLSVYAAVREIADKNFVFMLEHGDSSSPLCEYFLPSLKLEETNVKCERPSKY
jgi:hypothetical protein